MQRAGVGLGLVVVVLAALVVAHLLTRVADPPPMPPDVVTPSRTVHSQPPEAPPTTLTAATTLPVPLPLPLPLPVEDEGEAAHEVDIPPLLRDTEGPREAVRQAIEQHLPEMHECHQAWLQQNPALAGRMIVQFDITADEAGEGEVTHVELLEGGVGQVFVEGCVLNVFHGLRFPAPPDGQVTVVYPLQFDAIDDGGQ